MILHPGNWYKLYSYTNQKTFILMYKGVDYGLGFCLIFADCCGNQFIISYDDSLKIEISEML